MSLLYDPGAFPDDIPKVDVSRIVKKIDWLWINRAFVNHHPLKDNLSGFFKLRLGNYRIIYEYDDVTDELRICMIGTRDTIYHDAGNQYS